MTAAISYRLATISDQDKAKDMLSVVNNAFLAEGWASARHFTKGDRLELKDIEGYIINEKQNIYIALSQDQEVVGTLMVEFKGDDKVYMGILTTKPGWQSMGIGGGLMRKAILDTQSLGYKTAEIAVVEGRGQLFAWYNRLGFFETGQEQDIYGDQFHGNHVRILTMEKQLTMTN
ncbi:acyl-CoA N-acyltransferase [Hesseltinella vesiculosa]|uniref:Acyl-CoA N-acyltransferase n=1 Tax=Hesseltinella vesiculosa TaxID=101127 RepID=A0A1X2GIE8_9FUNG|nr:acyl-CoA N-acyltransferase [Hesseltinella vesiculosa]